jgi:aminoglycoside 3-N-acetyltransferase I
MVNRNHLSNLLSNPNFLVFVAINDGVVIGGLTVYVLHQYYSEKPLAYIYDVGVAPSFQGQGTGKSLILAVCTYCKEHGFEDAYVEAEFEDVNAVNFYRKTNFTEELQAIHFTYSF